MKSLSKATGASLASLQSSKSQLTNSFKTAKNLNTSTSDKGVLSSRDREISKSKIFGNSSKDIDYTKSKATNNDC